MIIAIMIGVLPMQTGRKTIGKYVFVLDGSVSFYRDEMFFFCSYGCKVKTYEGNVCNFSKSMYFLWY